MKKFIKALVHSLRKVVFNKVKESCKLVIVTNGSESDDNKFDEIKVRVNYIGPDIIVEKSNGLSLIDIFNYKSIGYLGEKKSVLLKKVKHEQVFNFDYETNSDDGWEYHRLLKYINKEEIEKNRVSIQNKLRLIKEALNKKYTKAYIFGTGPSLEKATEQTWEDGVRIVSNTIVKDKELWKHINPNFIVAGDAIYHFGISDFAKAFRRDLAERLSETDTYFVFQEHFLPFVKQNFPQFLERLIPIPVKDTISFYNIIEAKFELPAVGNVLNNILLPLGCYLSDNICLWGFDGRGPADKLFWKNSDRHFYVDLVPQLQKLHPAFFEVLVPKANPSQYVNSVHGDLLNSMMEEAERQGKTFHMMHFSYTKTLMDRYDKGMTTK